MPVHQQLHVAVTLATEHRAPYIKLEFEERVWQAITERCEEKGCRVDAIGGMPDHVHLLLALSPDVAVGEVVADAMTATLELMATELAPKARFEWQASYGAFTLRADEVGGVARYIQMQKQLHLENRVSKRLERTRE